MLNFQSSVSHDPSEIIIICWFGAQKIFLINVENCLISFLQSLVNRKFSIYLNFFNNDKVISCD